MTATVPPGAERTTGAVDDRAFAFPMSYSQQRLWFLDRLNPGTASYNVESVTPLDGPIDVRALAAAINDIIDRHDVLRTSFREIDGEPCQIVLQRRPIEVPIVDVSHLPDRERQRELERLLVSHARRGFDLASDPLIRATIICTGPQRRVLALQMHHIVSDGWSMGIFARELSQHYAHRVLGEPLEVPELPIQYADFAVWQREWLTGHVLDDQLDYWTDRLADLPVLELPTDRPRPPVQSFEGAFHTVRFPSDLHRRLVALGNQEQCTMFITLLAGFQLLLSRWSGQDDVVIGTYIANRRRREVHDLIGFFLNTLVLRTSVEAPCTFRELLGRTRETALGAYDHQDLPFELLVDALRPERDLSRNPLFQVTFQLNNSPTQAIEDNTIDSLSVRRGSSMFDLAFTTFETVDGLAGQIEYSTALFDADTIERLADRFVQLLDAVVEAPDEDVRRLPFLTETERERALRAINLTGHRHPWEQGLLELFERQVEIRPHADAFFAAGGDALTYADLDRRSRAIARRLSEHQVAGGIVGVHLPRSLDVPAVVLGILRAGAAWLPLEPHLPAARRAFMAADAGVSAVVTMRALADELPHDSLLFVDDIDEADGHGQLAGAQADGRQRLAPVRPNDLAYVIYTSGSTGQPKGVGAAHGQIINRLHWMWNTYPFEAGEVGACKTSLGFIDSIWELFGAMLQGVPSIVVDDDAARDPHALVAELGAARVTRLWLVPSLLRSLLDHFPDLDRRLPALRFWVASGEALPGDLLHRFRIALPEADLYNLYGTSEIWDATWCDPSGVDVNGRVPIGRPIDNVRAYVLDQSLQLAPPGSSGELCVAGAGLAFGYIGRPDLTAERFVDVELAPGVRERVYRTGDLARLRNDLQIEHLGRLDGQVKIRGVRVEPSEIEAALTRHPDVTAAAVRHVDGGEETRLIGWYETAGGPLLERELRAHLAGALPAAMIPSRFVFVDRMPLTSSGKIDRTRLPDAVPAAPERHRHEPPRGEIEVALTAIWREVLGCEQVGRDDDFFADLGGHSLQATRIVARIVSDHHVELPLQVLFSTPTIAGVAAAISELGVSDPSSTGGSIRRLARDAYRMDDA